MAYDTTMCIWNSGYVEARQLVALAYKGALTIQQQITLLSHLDRHPKIVYHIGLTPTKVISYTRFGITF